MWDLYISPALLTEIGAHGHDIIIQSDQYVTIDFHYCFPKMMIISLSTYEILAGSTVCYVNNTHVVTC